MNLQNVDFQSGLNRARTIMHVANRTHDGGHLAQFHSDIVKRPSEVWGRANSKMVSTVHGRIRTHPDLDTQPVQHFFSRKKLSSHLADHFRQDCSAEFAGISQRIPGFVGNNFGDPQSSERPPRSGSVEEGVSKQFNHNHKLADHDPGYEATCPHCGQRFLDNGWTGYTPIYENGYGERTWVCPTCGGDMKQAPNRPLDWRSASEFANPLYRPHYLWHDPGTFGRGLVHPNGSVYTWPEEEATHAQRSRALDIDPFDYKRHFIINPDNTFSMHMLPGRQLPSNDWLDYINDATQLNHSALPGQEVLGAWGRGKVVRAKFAKPSGDLSQRLSDFYHLAPTEERDRIRSWGLQPSWPGVSERWGEGEENEARDQPMGVYVYDQPFGAHEYTGEHMDRWRIPASEVQEKQEEQWSRPYRDKGMRRYVIPHPIENPLLDQPYEESPDAQKRYWDPNTAWKYEPGAHWNRPEAHPEWGIGFPDRVVGKLVRRAQRIDDWIMASDLQGGWQGPYCVVDITDSSFGQEYIVRVDAEGKDASAHPGQEGVDWEYIYVPANEAKLAS